MTTIKPQVEVVSLSADVTRTFRLAVPLIIAQILHMSSGLVDSIIAGKVSPTTFSAAGAATPLFFIVLLGCMGLINGLSPIFARLIGEGRSHEIGERYRQGLWYGSAACLIGFFLVRFIADNLAAIQIDAELIAPSHAYLKAVSWALLFAPVVFVSRNLFEATENSQPVMIVTIIAIVVNVIGSYVLALGRWGFPSMGIAGIGYATSLSFAFMSIASIYLLTRQRYAHLAIFSTFSKPNLRLIRAMLTLAFPIAMSLLAESGLFTAVAVQAAIMGEVESGANLIAIQTGSLCFMLPLGLSFVIVARVGNAFGRQHFAGVRQRLQSGIIIAILMSCLTVTSLVVFREPIIAVFTDEAPIQQLAMSLMLAVAVFQLSDTTQAIFAAVLRGLHDTKVPMLICVFSYWVVGFGSGLLLAYPLGYGIIGLWGGLILGLTSASILLGIRLQKQLRKLGNTSPIPDTISTD